MRELIKRYFMPFMDGPGCVLGTCDPPAFPVTEASCICDVAVGGINELYFVPCTETMSEANLTDIEWWQGLVDDQKIGRSGLGLGSIGKKSTTSDRVASCRPSQLTGITWALKFLIKCFDKTSARTTCAKLNELITKADKYLCIARMCDGSDTILPIGTFATTDFDWVVPDNSEENQNAMFELSWKEIGFPCTLDVAGLSAVVPKLA